MSNKTGSFIALVTPPRWANYIATDQNGEVCVYSSKPQMDIECWVDNLRAKRCYQVLIFNSVKQNQKWKSSLRQKFVDKKGNVTWKKVKTK